MEALNRIIKNFRANLNIKNYSLSMQFAFDILLNIYQATI